MTDGEIRRAYVHRAIRARNERASTQLKVPFKALRNVSPCSWRIGDVVAATLVLFDHEHSAPPDHQT
ncbi:hypothetical protein [Acrocarpospora pleiomorpha]|uniref:hypothetical protein n=1 Tax=Acrocarpospora pleiomorpha TaxID=90975 RepID=UPI0012D2B471|nr:hypothetical protein [Acrocarpospora pleiomorpha]